MHRYPDYLFIPEGGSHKEALHGISAMMDEIYSQIFPPDYYIVPVGTGATLAGMVRARRYSEKIVGVSALKTSRLYHYLNSRWDLDSYDHWLTAEQWHWGGYGKAPDPLIRFLHEFQDRHQIRLDPLYNGKAMYALSRYIQYGIIPPGSKVVLIHTGGLQGWRGIRYRNKKFITK